MNRIREARQACGFSQKYVAMELGVKGPSVSNWENGKTNPTQENIVALASLFGVSVDYLLGVDVEDNQRTNDIEQVGGDEPEQELTAAVEQLAPDARATMKELLKFMQGLTDEKQTEVSNYALTSAKVMAEMNTK